MKDEETYEERLCQAQKTLLTQVMKRRILAVGIILFLIAYLYLEKVGLGSSFDIKYAHWASLLLLSLWVVLTIFICIKYTKYLSTFLHNYYATPNIFMCGYLLSAYLFVSIVPFIILREYYYIVAIIVSVIVPPVYFWNRAANLTKINFEYLYSLSNGKILFNHFGYVERISRDTPKIYTKFVYAVFSLAVVIGLVGHSFHSDSKLAIALGLATLSVFLVTYPMFIYAFYFFVVVHPHVAKAFMQPVLSDPINVFKVLFQSLDTRLENDIFGENPIKRMIKYEEVFHK